MLELLQNNDVIMLAPYVLFALAGLYLLFADIFKRTYNLELILFIVSIVICLTGGLIYSAQINNAVSTIFSNKMLISDPMGSFGIFTVIAVLLFSVIISRNFLSKYNYRHGEYYSLLFFSLLGMMLLISGSNFVLMFIGLEIMSIPLYILSGFLKEDVRSKEAAMKYFVLGAFSTGIFAMGITFVYGSTGGFNLYEIMSGPVENQTLLTTGLGMIMIGLGFKVALVPFHMWVPDVYDGAPTPVVAFMSVAVKVATFLALTRIFVLTLNAYSMPLNTVLLYLAIITMTLGNLAAIYQKNIKRMLAYSSIAHAGYMLIAIIAAKGGSLALGVSSLIFYLVVYCAMTFGSFAVVSYHESKEGSKNLIEDFSGLGTRRPFLALCLSVFMLSLAGIPLTAGFMGKLYIFGAAIKAGFLGLAIIGVINSLLSVYYYLRVIVCMYMKKSPDDYSPSPTFEISFAVIVSALIIIVIGVYPDLLLRFTDFISYIAS